MRSITASSFALVIFLAACSKAPPAEEPVRAVRTQVVGVGSAAVIHEYAAEVKARTESKLGFRVGGKLVRRLVEAGDVESATLAAQGYRFRVPYGTLLCVSDKPLHGELKLPGQANHFYERAIREHIDIGIETVGILRDFGSRLHSRKLRAFDEPPFR